MLEVRVGELRASLGLLRSKGGLEMNGSLLLDGDLALLADSMNQCFIEASWLMKGCLEERRLWRPWAVAFGGAKRSWFEATSWSVLPRDLLLSLGGRGGRCRDELCERT